MKCFEQGMNNALYKYFLPLHLYCFVVCFIYILFCSLFYIYCFVVCFIYIVFQFVLYILFLFYNFVSYCHWDKHTFFIPVTKTLYR